MAELGEHNCPLFDFDDESDDDIDLHVHEHDSMDEENECNQALGNEKDAYSEHEDIDESKMPSGSQPPETAVASTSLILEELKRISSSVNGLSERLRKTEKNVKVLAKSLTRKKSTSSSKQKEEVPIEIRVSSSCCIYSYILYNIYTIYHQY